MTTTSTASGAVMTGDRKAEFGAFTPGPWRLDRDCGWIFIEAGPLTVAQIMETKSAASEANARLIAAAPEMYEALSVAVESLESIAWRSEYLTKVYRRMETALRKASGLSDHQSDASEQKAGVVP